MSDADNADQQAFWSGPSGQQWLDEQSRQDAFLRNINRVVLDRAALKTGDAVLDIGCGTGDLSVDAAKVVGETGRVLATDISEPLLARAAERLSAFPQASTLLADGQTADWPKPPFDHAISRIGVMFFNDPPRAFANIARALRSGGCMTFAAWAPAAVNPYWSEPQKIAVRRFGQPPKVAPNTPGPMGLADRALTIERFHEAGIEDVAVEPVNLSLTFDHGALALADLMLRIGPAARVARLFDATEAESEALRDDLAQWLSTYDDGGIVRLPAVINLIEARRP